MAPTHNRLKDHQQWIVSEYHKGTSVDIILDQLQIQHDIKVVRSTLYRWLKTWGCELKQTRTRPTAELQACVLEAFFEYGMSDMQLKAYAESKGFQVSLRGIEQIRYQSGIMRRYSADQLQVQLDHLRTWFHIELRTENIASRIGRSNLQVHLRQRQFVIPRDPLFQLYREFHDQDIRTRKYHLQQRRGGWTTPGPNFMWCIDAYLKLAPYGFEIYAAIDAHSRFIPWFYCGYTALTARSVLSQYLSIVSQWNFIPLMMRSDRGNETPLVAMAHWFLSRNTSRLQPRNLRSRQPGSRQMVFNPSTFTGDPNTLAPVNSSQAESAPALSTPVEFRDVWSYGKSTENQRIESWWRQLCEGRALF
jgi:hypothetical protein